MKNNQWEEDVKNLKNLFEKATGLKEGVDYDIEFLTFDELKESLKKTIPFSQTIKSGDIE